MFHPAGNSWTRRDGFQMPTFTTSTKRSIRDDSNMPQLGCKTVCTEQQLVINDHPASNSCADSNINQVVVTNTSTKAPFTHGSQVRIITNGNWNFEVILDQFF